MILPRRSNSSTRVFRRRRCPAKNPGLEVRFLPVTSPGARKTRQPLTRFGSLTLMDHMELTLSLEDKARRKALSEARRLPQDAPPHDAEPDHTKLLAW